MRELSCCFPSLFQLALLGDVPLLLSTETSLPTATTRCGLSVSETSALLSPGIVLATLAFLASRLVCVDGGVRRLRWIVADHAARIIQMRWRIKR